MSELSLTAPVSSLFLGTSSWGLKVKKSEAYRIVESFYDNNFRWVDTSTNYPIDGNPENYGQTIAWLSEFRNDFPELKIFVKVGSANNLGESTQLVNASYFALIFDVMLAKLSSSLGGLGIHWDYDKSHSDRTQIVKQFLNLHERGFAVGLSGIEKPEIYSATEIGMNLPWILQKNVSPIKIAGVPEEIVSSRILFPKARIFGYNLLGGIKAVGIPNEKERLSFLGEIIQGSPSPKNEDSLGYLISYVNSLKLDGIIVGPTTEAQCKYWCTFIDRINLV